MKKYAETGSRNPLLTRVCKNIFIFGFLFFFSTSILGKEPPPQSQFLKFLAQEKPSLIKTIQSPLDKRLLSEYGTVFVNQEEVNLPSKIIFSNAEDYGLYRSKLNLKVAVASCSLQAQAAIALQKAIKHASQEGITISPRGDDSCIRSYELTEKLWLSRVNPNLDYYTKAGKLSTKEAEKVRKAKLPEQINLVLDLEKKKGLLFDKYRQTSILNSVAAPGSSQHLTGLAFDLRQFEQPRAREIMNQNGWYQTVANDLPHFTYLGKITPEQLKESGILSKKIGQYTFLVPDYKP
jgi:LAS superfamily LD-carboxypeptidase LdcB